MQLVGAEPVVVTSRALSNSKSVREMPHARSGGLQGPESADFVVPEVIDREILERQAPLLRPDELPAPDLGEPLLEELDGGGAVREPDGSRWVRPRWLYWTHHVAAVLRSPLLLSR